MQSREWMKTIRFYAAFAAAYFVFTSVAFAQYYIPSESMRPTLEVGDRLLVNKFAYGWSRYSLPILLAERTPLRGRLMARAPQRGDVIVFRRPDEAVILIKRVVALPGETAQVLDGQVFIDGAPVALDADATFELEGGPAQRQREDLPGRAHYVYDAGATFADQFGPYLVPDDCFLVLGDNRDASADSRFWGCVPMENIVGRAEAIVWSFAWRHPDPGGARRGDRFWRAL